MFHLKEFYQEILFDGVKSFSIMPNKTPNCHMLLNFVFAV